MRRPSTKVNTMWAIDDFTDMNGSTLIWPGTHIKPTTTAAAAAATAAATALAAEHDAGLAAPPPPTTSSVGLGFSPHGVAPNYQVCTSIMASLPLSTLKSTGR